MLANIAFTDCAEDRVCQSVERDIGIGVAFERMVVVNIDAADAHGAALIFVKGVNVKAKTSERHGLSGKNFFGHDEILRVGDFDVAGAAFDQCYRDSDGTDKGGVIGCICVRIGGFMRFE